MNFYSKLILAALLFLLMAPASHADVTLPRLLGDGVILQRDTPVTIWGWANDGEVVRVYLDEKIAATTTAAGGKWQVAIAPQTAGGPHQLTVSGENSVMINDVYFGDVWVASGQSNMQLPMQRVKDKYAAQIAAANDPLIREFEVPRESEFIAPRADVGSGSWRPTTPESVLGFSAVAYFFAKSIHEQYDVPVGIISSNYGGSAAESWMSEQALEAYPHYLEIAQSYQDEDYFKELLAADQAVADQWALALDRKDAGLRRGSEWSAEDVDVSDWQVMSVPGKWADTSVGPVNGVVWFRKTIELPEKAAGQPATLHLGRVVDADTTYVNGEEVGNITYMYPPRRYDIAPGILKAGENTIAVRVVNYSGNGGFWPDKPYSLDVGDTQIDLKGPWRFRVGAVSEPMPPQKFVRHRQPLGFYNAMLAPLLNMRIKGTIWYQGETNVGRAQEYQELFPAMIAHWRDKWQQGNFPFLFVQLANFLEAKTEPEDSAWAELREAQRLSLSVPNTAMAVAIDVGEWNDIHPLDKKSVGDRLALAARKLAYGEKQLVSSGPVFDKLEIDGNTLVVHFRSIGSGLRARGGKLHEFAVAGADGNYHWAEARISGGTVRVRSDSVAEPVSVRYAWADNPAQANLYNAEGLPASPFEATLAADD